MKPIIQDIYFSESYGKLYEKIEQGKFEVFECKTSNGSICYPFLIRPIPFQMNNETYYDIITPYGYGGPILTQYEFGFEDEVITEFERSFDSYCKEKKVVSEFVRFHPLEQNHQYFGNYYDTQLNRITISIDLSKDFFNDQYSSRCRNQVRKAQKQGLYIEFDDTENGIDSFLEVYTSTMLRNDAQEFYYFDKSYFVQMFTELQGNCFFINAKFDDKVISSSLFLTSDKYIHYHLSGSLSEYFGMCANQLIIHSAAEWGALNSKAKLHLGGGVTSKPDDPILHFKKNFSLNGLSNFFIGKKIHNNAIYDKFVKYTKEHLGKEQDSTFFPIYRAPRLNI